MDNLENGSILGHKRRKNGRPDFNLTKDRTLLSDSVFSIHFLINFSSITVFWLVSKSFQFFFQTTVMTHEWKMNGVNSPNRVIAKHRTYYQISFSRRIIIKYHITVLLIQTLEICQFWAESCRIWRYLIFSNERGIQFSSLFSIFTNNTDVRVPPDLIPRVSIGDSIIDPLCYLEEMTALWLSNTFWSTPKFGISNLGL